MTRKELLAKATTIVTGERDAQYGGPEDNFNRIANLWNAYLGQVDLIGPEDVAVMMMLLKVARIAASEYKSMDSWVDIAGYAACGAEIAGGEEA
jgi:hypothetical protein